ncbi:MAG: hypothetical protein RL322_2337, partial [Pseudomonadota bacterium]
AMVFGGRFVSFDSSAVEKFVVHNTNANRNAPLRVLMDPSVHWGRTGLTVRTPGLLDLSAATLSGGTFDIEAVGIKPQSDGMIRTRAAGLSIVNTGAAPYQDILVREQNTLTVGTLRTLNGRIDLQLAARDSTLTVTGGVRTLSGGNILLVADDMDFVSGQRTLGTTGVLTIRTQSADIGYRLGTAAIFGTGLDNSVKPFTGYMELSPRDIAALDRQATQVSIGHRGTGIVEMIIGDLRDDSTQSALGNDTLLIADRMRVQGDVIGLRRVSTDSHTLEIARTGILNPTGPAASGITAQHITIDVDEQAVVSGWLRGLDSLTLTADQTNDVRALLFRTGGRNSLSVDQSGEIGVLNDNATMTIRTAGSIYTSGALYAGRTTVEGLPTSGSNAVLDIESSTGISMQPGALITARDDLARIRIASQTFLHVNVDTAITAGARFRYSGSTPIPELTGINTELELSTQGELLLAGSVTSGGEMSIVYGETQDDFADYFDNLSTRALASIPGTASEITSLRNGQLSSALLAAIQAKSLPLTSSAAVVIPVGGVTPFGSLSTTDQNAAAIRGGYAVFENGGFFRSDATGALRFFETPTIGYSIAYDPSAVSWPGAAPTAGTPFAQLSAADQQAVAQSLGYTRYTGTLLFNPDALDGRYVIDAPVQGLRPDYQNSDIQWGAVGAPAANAGFLDLTLEQKLVVAQSLGYKADLFYSIETPPAGMTVTMSEFVEGVHYQNVQIEWGIAGAPPAGAAFENLTLLQKLTVARNLGYELSGNLEFYNDTATEAKQRLSGDAGAERTFLQGAPVDFDNTEITWGAAGEPEDDAGFADLTAAQKAVVAQHMGYQLLDAPAMFIKASAPRDQQIAYGFAETTGAVFDYDRVDWDNVTAPASGTAFADLTDDQQFKVLDTFGYTRFTERVFYKASESSESRAVRTTLTAVADYPADLAAAEASTKRWVVTDGPNSYVVYAYDETGAGTNIELQVQNVHPLFGQRGYGFLLLGTLTTLEANQGLTVQGPEDVIVRGNINLLGAGADLTLQSDRWVYWDGSAQVMGEINLFGGVEVDGSVPAAVVAANPSSTGGANIDGISVYVSNTSTLNTLTDEGNIFVQGGQDVLVLGRIVAGAEIGANKPNFVGDGDTTATVKAGQSIFVDSVIAAAKSVDLITTGTPGPDDGGMAVTMTSASGLLVPGITSDNTGARVGIDARGNVQIVSTITAGAEIFQTFDGGGNLQSERIDWVTEQGVIDIQALGQVYLGGMTATQSGGSVEIGGRLRASQLIEIQGGSNSDGVGVKLPGGAQLSTRNDEGEIRIDAAQDAEIYGLLVAGGTIVDAYDLDGKYLGSTPVYGSGESEIHIEADRQIRLTRELYAGSLIDLRGGQASINNSLPFFDQGIVIGGSATLRTGLQESVINLSSSGNLSVLTPAWTQQLMAQGFAERANGRLAQDVTLRIEVDLGTHVVRGDVVLTAASTQDNVSLQNAGNPSLGLVGDLQAAINATQFTVITSLSGNPAVNSTRQISSSELEVRLNDGRIMFTGGYKVKVLNAGSVNAARLGFTQLASGDLTSSRAVAVDASQPGSVVNFGKQGAINGDVTISGWVIGHEAINLYGGLASAGLPDVTLTATGVFETRSGDIVLRPRGHAVLQGTLAARGDNANIIIQATDTLELRGDLIANRDIVVNAGTVPLAGETSLATFGTARLISEGPTGRIMLTGLNDVEINSQIGRDRNNARNTGITLVQITADQGTLHFGRDALIDTVGEVRMSGNDLIAEGWIISDRLTDSVLDYELSFRSAGDMTLSGQYDLDGSVLIEAGGALSIYNTSIELSAAGQRLIAQAAGDIRLGATGMDILPVTLPDVLINGATSTASDDRTIDLGSAGLVSGARYFLTVGTTVVSYTAAPADGAAQIATGLRNALHAVGAYANKVIATGTQILIDDGAGNLPIAVQYLKPRAVVLEADRLIELTAGGSLITGADSLVLSRAAGSRLAASAASMRLDGQLLAGASYTQGNSPATTWTGLNAELELTSRGAIEIGGLRTADNLALVASGAVLQATGQVRMRAGSDSSGTGVDLGSASSIRVDATGGGVLTATQPGRILIDSDGAIFVDGLINAVDSGSTLQVSTRSLFQAFNLVRASAGIRIDAGTHSSGYGVSVVGQFSLINNVRTLTSGGVLDTDTGGTLDITSTGSMLLAGVVGQVTGSSNEIGKISRITLESRSGDVMITGLVDARDDISITGDQIGMTLGSHVFALQSTSKAYLRARERMDIMGQISTNDAIIKGDRLVHLAAPIIYVDGILKTEADNATRSRVLVNVSQELKVAGLIQSAGDVHLNAGVDLSLTREALEGEITQDMLSGGLIRVIGQGVVQSGMKLINNVATRSTHGGDLVALSGGDVVLSADSTVGGNRSVVVPVVTTVEEAVETIVGYQEVAVGTMQVPVITKVPTLITEQVGTELVKVGSKNYSFDVTLEQVGYYKVDAPSGAQFRETFIEGIDYHNYQINWANAGTDTDPGASAAGDANLLLSHVRGEYTNANYKTFTELNDVQRQAVLNYLGYKPLFDFSYSGKRPQDSSATPNQVVLQQTLNGNVTYNLVTPSWANNPAVIVAGDVYGWKDKYIRMPGGAQKDVEKVISQGTPQYLFNDTGYNTTGNLNVLRGQTSPDGLNGGQWAEMPSIPNGSVKGEWVGEYQEQARLNYIQDKSVYTPQAGSSRGGLFGISWLWGSRTSYYDWDQSIGRWAVFYPGGGTWNFEVASRGSLSMAGDPTWAWDGAFNASKNQFWDYETGGRETQLVYGGSSLLGGKLNSNQETADTNQISQQFAGWRFVGGVVVSTKFLWWTWTRSYPIFEIFKNYSYDWYSTTLNRNIYDQRVKLSYNAVTFAEPIYDYRPVYQTTTKDVTVVNFQDVTVWESQPITATSYVTRTEQGTKVIPLLGPDYSGESLFAANDLRIQSGRNANFSGKVKAYDNLDISASGSIAVTPTVDNAGIARLSMMGAGKLLSLRSGGTLSIETPAEIIGRDLILTADRGATINGQIGGRSVNGVGIDTQTITVSAVNDIRVGGSWAAQGKILIAAGEGTGSFGGVYTIDGGVIEGDLSLVTISAVGTQVDDDRTVTLPATMAVVTGGRYTLDLGADAVTHIAQVGDTVTTIAAALAQKIALLPNFAAAAAGAVITISAGAGTRTITGRAPTPDFDLAVSATSIVSGGIAVSALGATDAAVRTINFASALTTQGTLYRIRVEDNLFTYEAGASDSATSVATALRARMAAAGYDASVAGGVISLNGVGTRLIEAIDGDSIEIRAGQFGGNIVLATSPTLAAPSYPMATLSTPGVLQMSAPDGRILHQQGLIKANRVEVIGGSTVDLNTRIGTLDVQSLGAGNVTVTNKVVDIDLRGAQVSAVGSAASDARTITLPVNTPVLQGAHYKLKIGNDTVSYIAGETDTLNAIATGLAARINTLSGLSASAVNTSQITISSGAGVLDLAGLTSSGAFTLERALLADGALTVNNTGSLIVLNAQTLGGSDRNNITLNAIRTNGEVNLAAHTISAAGRGDITLDVQGSMVQRTGGLLSGDRLTIRTASNGNLQLVTDVNDLALDINRTGNVAIQQTGTRTLHLVDSDIVNGSLTVNAAGAVSLVDVELASNRETNNITVTAVNDIAVNRVVAGSYLQELPIGLAVSVAHGSDVDADRTVNLGSLAISEGAVFRISIAASSITANDAVEVRHVAAAADTHTTIAAALAKQLSAAGYGITATSAAGIITLATGAGTRAIVAQRLVTGGDVLINAVGSASTDDRTISFANIPVVVGAQYRLTIGPSTQNAGDSAVIRTTAVSGDTIDTIVARLAATIDDNASFSATSTGAVITIDDGAGLRVITAFDAVTSAGSITLTSTAGAIERAVGSADRNLIANNLTLTAQTGIRGL